MIVKLLTFNWIKWHNLLKKDAALEIDNLNDCFSDRSVAVQNIIIIITYCNYTCRNVFLIVISNIVLICLVPYKWKHILLNH